ncbi:HNH/endonuclease VII fold putative polymorphic toxin [Bacillus sp. CGMCC 1.60114]|uniref:HNH/endonuclease VII fold putative polymorphic toxin n=1 Tax=unclassified Bacillus (in: firmicutes) TaxID=185979 RepID=UPI00363BE67F
MSLNMYLGEVRTQSQSMNAFCVATIQGMEQVINSIDTFAFDAVLQGQTYDSAKTFFAQTFRPLAQGIIYLCEELIRQNDAFLSDFQSKVASTDVIEHEILDQIREIERTKAGIEGISSILPGMQVMVNIFDAMKRKLQEKLEHLHEFNYTSSSNYDTALQLAASIAQGLAEVQSGKGFSPASGTFSTQELNMGWTTSIQEIAENKAREAEKLKTEVSDSNSEKSLLEKIGDGIWDGAGQAVGDTIDGIVALGKWETWENMGYAVTHLDETLPAMWNTLSDSFINDVINGDAESRAKWGSYALTQVGLGLIGDKGISKISKVTTLAKGANISKFSQGMSQVANKLNMEDRLAFAFADTSEITLRSNFDSPALSTLVFAKGMKSSVGLSTALDKVSDFNASKSFEVKKIEGENSHESRGASLKEIKRQLNIPKSQHPISQKMVPLTDSNGKWILNDNKQPIMTRELTYEVKGQKIVIQDHSAGHDFGQGGIGDQPPHHNVRPEYNTRTGQVDGMADHYYFEKRNKK